MRLLTQAFLDKYPNEPEHMTEIGRFTFYRTYSRWLENEKRRETFKEAIARAVDYNVSIAYDELNKIGFEDFADKVVHEAEILFDNVFNLKQALSGRTHWVGGANTKVADKFPLSNFNCAFTEINAWRDISELFYLLLVGTGVGVSCSKEMANNLPPVRRNYELTHSEYNPVGKASRLEHTKINVMDNGYTKIYVGDSKEGWVDALKYFLEIITNPLYDAVRHIKISYNSIRPKGEKLNTFGGTASGHESLRDMFTSIDKVFKDQLDTSLEPMMHYAVGECETDLVHVRPIHILDICNLIGNNVVVGGVRRTAEIFLFDVEDLEVMFAKYAIYGIKNIDEHNVIGDKLEALGIKPKWWNDEEALVKRKSLTHRAMSNNSVRFHTKPKKELLEVIFELMKSVGEPGFVNLESANKRRPNAKGLNPCAEILLDNKQVCNLTTLNVKAFVRINEGVPVFDVSGLIQAQALSVRAGMRMTCIDMELPEWNKMHKRDRLIGASLTGWKDAIEMLGYDKDQEEQILSALRGIAREEAIKYANILRIPVPLLITSVKPEGTLSQVFGSVSNGLHYSHSPYFLRRIRVTANDPMMEVARQSGWKIWANSGTNECYNEELLATQEYIDMADTLVVEFPVESGATTTKADLTIEEQFDNYLMFQDFYTEHNASNTIDVKDGEWGKAVDLVYDNWNDFIAVSFLPYSGGDYALLPYKTITKEEYEAYPKQTPFSIELLHKIEKEETEKDMVNLESCSTGVCPIF